MRVDSLTLPLGVVECLGRRAAVEAVPEMGSMLVVEVAELFIAATEAWAMVLPVANVPAVVFERFFWAAGTRQVFRSLLATDEDPKLPIVIPLRAPCGQIQALEKIDSKYVFGLLPLHLRVDDVIRQPPNHVLAPLARPSPDI
jgi:hypothetical protein